MQMVLCLNFFDDAHYYYLDYVLGTSAIGYDVLKMIRQLHRCLAIFSTNRGQAGATNPWQAVQLSTGDYVFSCGTSPGVVNVVGVDGQVVCSYDQSQTSSVGPTNNPRSLAVTKKGDILVADYCNSRILSMNNSLGSIQVLALPVDGGIQQPWGLCLDE